MRTAEADDGAPAAAWDALCDYETYDVEELPDVLARFYPRERKGQMRAIFEILRLSRSAL